MNIKRFFQIMVVVAISMWTASATAQDDAYFDPSTDEIVETKHYKKAQSNEDEVVDYPYEDNQSVNADDDFYFTRRIRRFGRRSRNNFGFFNNWYANDVFYDNSFGSGWGVSTRPTISVIGGNVYNTVYNPYTSTSYYGGYSPSNSVGLGVNNSYYDPCAQYGGYGYSQNSSYVPTNNSRPTYNYAPRKGGKGRSVGVVKPSRTRNTAASRPSSSNSSNSTNATRSSSRKVRSSSRSRSSYSAPSSSSNRSSSTRSSSSSSTRSSSTRSSSRRGPRR